MNENEVFLENEKLIYKLLHHFNVNGELKEELKQECWLGFCKALKTFNEDKNVKFSTYCYKVMHLQCLCYLRKYNRKKIEVISLDSTIKDDTTMLELTPSPTNIEQKITSDLDWNNLLKKLKQKNKEIIQMYTDYYTQKEIAQHFNLSQAQVSRIIKKFTKKMNFFKEKL